MLPERTARPKTLRNRARAKRRIRSLAAAALLAASALPYSASQAAPRPEPELVDLQSVDDLRGAFDRDAGRVRLVLLLSPT